MRVLVCGGRRCKDQLTLGSWLGGIHKDHTITAIIHGGANGADTLAGLFGEYANIPVEVFPANWKRDGRAAGPIRNARMLEKGRPDLVLAFAGGKGTADMISKAKAAGIPVTIGEPIQ